jgi:hypothetical protein
LIKRAVEVNLRKSVKFIALVWPLAIGCGQSVGIVGSVTYNGEVVEKGSIAFMPVDGRGQPFGAEIVDGRYEADKPTAGKRIATVRGLKKVNFGRTSEESLKNYEDAKAGGKEWAGNVSEPTDYIPETAAGNGQTVEITAGRQTLDFAITGPPRAK